MKILMIAGACALLAACATDGVGLDPKVEIKEVPILAPVSCVPKDTPQPGAYADANMASITDPVERMKARAGANQQRKARLAVVEPILAGCR